jgi:cytosine/adenosine deaminase-related metal-dependent hydrolase
MLTVVGDILDADGLREGYAILDSEGRVVELGKKGTMGRGKGKKVQGIVLPRPVNGHTHLGDSVWGKEPPPGPLAVVVAPPDGLKHRILAGATDEAKVATMHRSLLHMGRSGIALTIDFREEGIGGVRQLRKAADGTGVEPYVLGRPTSWDDKGELSLLLDEADGLGLSALKDMDASIATKASQEAHRRGRFLSLHASEDMREPIGPILDLKPSLLVHLTKATRGDLESIADAHCPVAFCPRSNALFGTTPPMSMAQELGIPFILGTDNLMFNSPDIFREMEFAYLISRFNNTPVTPESLVRAVFVTPWSVIGREGNAHIVEGGKVQPLVLELPPGEDPYYQVCARGKEAHIIRQRALSPRSNR